MQSRKRRGITTAAALIAACVIHSAAAQTTSPSRRAEADPFTLRLAQGERSRALEASEPALSPSKGQAYPAKPVRVIVPVSAGGGTDVQARLLARKFQESMGQSFVVENRPGAGGNIGVELVAKSPADGYTILCTANSIAITFILYKRVAFDPFRDLAPVGQISSTPLFLIVHPSVPAKSAPELIALAKKYPGKLNAGSAGSGSSNHLAIEMFKQKVGIDVTHIPYKGGALSATALAAGEIDFTFTGALTALPHLRSGRVRGLAVTSLKRSSAAPNLPTLDSFYPGFEAVNWYALFAPAGTPPAVTAKLNSEIVKALQSPDIREFMSTESAEPSGGTPQELTAYFKREVEQNARVIKIGRIQVE